MGHVHEQSITRLLDEMKEHKYTHQLNILLRTMNNVKCPSQISSSPDCIAKHLLPNHSMLFFCFPVKIAKCQLYSAFLNAWFLLVDRAIQWSDVLQLHCKKFPGFHKI